MRRKRFQQTAAILSAAMVFSASEGRGQEVDPKGTQPTGPADLLGPANEASLAPPPYVSDVYRPDRPELLSAGVLALLGLDGQSRTPRERARLVKELSPRLGAADRHALIQWAVHRPPAAFHPSLWLETVNELIAKLRRQEEEGSGDALALCLKLEENEEAEPALREYALQHIASHVSLGLSPRSEDICLERLFAAASAEDRRAGAALLGLGRLARAGELSEAAVAQLEKAVVSACADADLAAPARSAAFQLAGDLRPAGAADHALDAALDDGASTVLRATALSALGRCGGRGHLERLSAARDRLPDALTPAFLSAVKALEASSSNSR